MPGILLSIEVKIQTLDNIYPLFVHSLADTWKKEKQMLACWCAEIMKSRSQKGPGYEGLHIASECVQTQNLRSLEAEMLCSHTAFSLWRSILSLSDSIFTCVFSLGLKRRQSGKVYSHDGQIAFSFLGFSIFKMETPIIVSLLVPVDYMPKRYLICCCY